MISTSVIQPELVQAYRETEYRVGGDMPLVLCIDQYNTFLASFYEQAGVRSCAFITACNPYSQSMDAVTNAERQDALAIELSQKGLLFFPAEGKHPSGGWPGEASFLVMGISLETATTLCTKFEQNAFVWCGSDSIPRLILLR